MQTVNLEEFPRTTT